MRTYYSYADRVNELIREIYKMGKAGEITRGSSTIEYISDTTAMLYVGNLIVPEGCLVMNENLETKEITRESKSYSQFFVMDYTNFATTEKLKRSLMPPEDRNAKNKVVESMSLSAIFFDEADRASIVGVGYRDRGKGVFSLAYFTGPVI